MEISHEKKVKFGFKFGISAGRNNNAGGVSYVAVASRELPQYSRG